MTINAAADLPALTGLAVARKMDLFSMGIAFQEHRNGLHGADLQVLATAMIRFLLVLLELVTPEH